MAINKKLIVYTFFFLFFLQISSIYATSEQPVGYVVKTEGEVLVQISKTKPQEKAYPGMPLFEGFIIKTGKNGRVSILLEDESMIKLNKNTQFIIQRVNTSAGWRDIRLVMMQESKHSIYQIFEGEMWIRNKNKTSGVTIKSPAMVTGIRGSEFTLKIYDNKSILSVLEGHIEASNEYGTIKVFPGEQAVASIGEPPRKQILLRPIDAVQWTIKIPRLLEYERIKDENLINAYNLLIEGEIRQAHTLLLGLAEKKPFEPFVWNMLAISALALGEKELSLSAAQKGIQLAPLSISSLIVMSYIHQAFFEIDNAIEILQKAMALEPFNVIVLLNLAKLKFGQGLIDEAFYLTNRAESISPDDPDIFNIKGFIYLAKLQTELAIKSFNKAIEIDSGAGEPHMGLAIAYMRKGDVATSIKEITTAVLLEPQRSIFVSYWSKMLYQLKRFDEALDLLAYAKKLDPNDPTPYLYSSVILRDLNRPHEAIESLEYSIKLNDNRAVYRGRFLLDSDLAIKNVDLSLIYSQLGLNLWARNRALSSIKQDYLNYSSHLFYAGTLREDGDRSWSYANEMLLARMLMPSNQNSFNTFNEYTTFFEKPSFGGTISGTMGNFNTKKGEIYTYGYVPSLNVAFGIGGVNFDTDGWRNTNYEREGNIAGILKWDITPNNSLMVVSSYTNSKYGEKPYPRYEWNSPKDEQSFSKNQLERYELGYNHRFSLNSNLLFYVSHIKDTARTYQNRIKDRIIDVNVQKNVGNPYIEAQFKYFLKTNRHQLMLGAIAHEGESNKKLIPIVNGNLIPQVFTKHKDSEKLFTGYIKDIFTVKKNLIIEGALYYENIKTDDIDYSINWDPKFLILRIAPYQARLHEKLISPRGGLIYEITENDTLRLAGYRYLMPFISSRLDPVDIAGIPIYRNNLIGSKIDEYDIVWEHKFSKALFSINVFYLERDYSTKIGMNNTVAKYSLSSFIRGIECNVESLLPYGFAVKGGARYRDVDDRMLPNTDRYEHQLFASFRFVHRKGLSGGLTQTYRYDHFKSSTRKNKSIWITDFDAGYELPGKIGSLKFEIKNIFNQHFDWVTDYFTLSGRSPKMEFFGKLSLNF